MSNRLSVVYLLFLVFFSLVFVKLFYWQIAAGDTLTGLAEQQRLDTSFIKAKRGSIFTRDGSPLVINQRAYVLFAQPRIIKKAPEAARALAKELKVDEATVVAQLTDTNVAWKQIATKVDESVAEKIKSYKLEGIGFMEDSKRYYPEGSMAAHLLGFVGKNAKGEDQGYFGLEGYYDEQVRGRDGLRAQEKDALGFPILLGRNQEFPVEDGRNIYLTIDKTVQFIAEKRLLEGIEKYQAKGGTVVVLEPKTGAILAMASYPSYDPAQFALYPAQYYKNPAVSSSYEPGSTFKVLIMAAAINEGSITTTTVYNEEGPVEIGGYRIRTWNQKYHGPITVAEVLQYSSNVGMVYVADKLGNDSLLSYINKFGFGSPTDVDLQDETTLPLRPHDKWYQIDFATASFGQGIAITPLQMVRAVAAIANGGNLVKPFLVKTIEKSDGKKIETQPRIERTILSKRTSVLLSEMMVKAVDNGETKYLKNQGLRIAGKTGTAQIPIQGHYDTNKTIASFVGFAPPETPRFIMLVTINEPTSSPWGSETAAPLFFNITKDLLPYFGDALKG